MTTVRSDRTLLHDSGGKDVDSTSAAIGLPGWLDSMVGPGSGGHQQDCRTDDGVAIRIGSSGHLSLCSARVDDAAGMGTDELRGAVLQTYRALFRAAAALSARHPVRMWSFIPGIHANRGDELSTYHVFNQGRFDSFLSMLGSDAEFATGLPTATGVGHDGADLEVHLLASSRAGVHIENPRQVPAYRYSTRYGPRPPCFARATLIEHEGVSLVLIGGTASVREEVSVHIGDLQSQIDETFENLAAVLEAAERRFGKLPERGTTGLGARCVHLRAYCPVASEKPMIREAIGRRIAAGVEVELIDAQLCREELLVEIEGVMRIPRAG